MAGAALDVFREEPCRPATRSGRIRAWRSPHIAAISLRRETVAQLAAKIRAFLRGKPVTGMVTRPPRLLSGPGQADPGRLQRGVLVQRVQRLVAPEADCLTPPNGTVTSPSKQQFTHTRPAQPARDAVGARQVGRPQARPSP